MSECGGRFLKVGAPDPPQHKIAKKVLKGAAHGTAKTAKNQRLSVKEGSNRISSETSDNRHTSLQLSLESFISFNKLPLPQPKQESSHPHSDTLTTPPISDNNINHTAPDNSTAPILEAPKYQHPSRHFAESSSFEVQFDRISDFNEIVISSDDDDSNGNLCASG